MANTSGRHRDRKSRKRGFDEDMPQEGGWSPPAPPSSGSRAPARRASAPASSGPELGAVVKRFDPERGFGFVTLESSGGDGFLHISTLQRAGIDAVRPGMRLRVRLGQGERGPQVIEVLEVAGGDEVPQAPPGDSGQSSRAGPLVGEGEEVRGVVKWYNAEKGFGFVARDGGGKDVFVHATALERSGVRSLTEGQAVTLRVVQGKKGPEAASVTGA